MTDAAADPLHATCLCAAWCRTCDAWRATYEDLRRSFPAVRFAWVDVEDEADALGDLDIVDFPTLALTRGDALLFCGPVLPAPAVARQLITRAVQGELAPGTSDPQLPHDLPARLRQIALDRG